MDTSASSTEPARFLFQRPEALDGVSESCNLAIHMGAISSRLVLEDRTRCEHPDGRAENVAEHSLMLAKVAPELAAHLYPELDVNLVARYATVHDDVEAYVGDTPTDRISAEGVLAKEDIEKNGLARLKAEYAHLPTYARLVEEYEAQEIPETRFVRVADKLMVLLIHFPNDGETLRQNYTYSSFLKVTHDWAESYRMKYAEFEEVIVMREELAQMLADKFLGNNG